MTEATQDHLNAPEAAPMQPAGVRTIAALTMATEYMMTRREPLWTSARAMAKDLLLKATSPGVPVTRDTEQKRTRQGAASQTAWDMVRVDAGKSKWTWTAKQISHDSGVSIALVTEMRNRLQYLLGYDMDVTGIWALDRGRAFPHQA